MYYCRGQLCASNYGAAFPKIWQKTFEPVLDSIPPKPFDDVRAIVESDLGRPLGEVFSSFDPQPMAAASIGQVHRAVLKADGRRVVVKVMYPEVEARFRGDVAISKAFFSVTMPEQAILLDEVEKQFANEFDYTREAAQLDLVRRNLAAAGTFSHIVVPEPVKELCTKRVLTMTEIVGAKKLTTALEEDTAAFAAEQGKTTAQLLAEEEALNDAALKRGELRCGPDAPSMASFINARKWRNRLGWLVGLPPAHVPLNHAWLMDELFRVHGHEVRQSPNVAVICMWLLSWRYNSSISVTGVHPFSRPTFPSSMPSRRSWLTAPSTETLTRAIC